METAWLHVLGKDNRGSHPRCILLVDGPKCAVAARLTELVGLAEVTVSPNDFWMPRDKTRVAEGRLDRDDGFVSRELQQKLRNWWLVSNGRANTPNWDLASTCDIDGATGLLLLEAKAHGGELSPRGKPSPTPNSVSSKANHRRIGEAIRQANAGLRGATGGLWNMSRDDHYQLSNRFAWAWKLATLGIPTVLVYLGFLNADDMTPPLFHSQDDWAGVLKDHARGVVDNSCWENRLDINGTPFWPLIRTIDLPFARCCDSDRTPVSGGP